MLQRHTPGPRGIITSEQVEPVCRGRSRNRATARSTSGRLCVDRNPCSSPPELSFFVSVSAASVWVPEPGRVAERRCRRRGHRRAPPEQQPGDRPRSAASLPDIHPQGREVEGHQVVAQTHRRSRRRARAATRPARRPGPAPRHVAAKAAMERVASESAAGSTLMSAIALIVVPRRQSRETDCRPRVRPALRSARSLCSCSASSMTAACRRSRALYGDREGGRYAMRIDPCARRRRAPSADGPRPLSRASTA